MAKKLVVIIAIFLLSAIPQYSNNDLSNESNPSFSEGNNYLPSFGTSSVYIGDGSVHLLANETVGVWFESNLSIYDLVTMSFINSYPCNAVTDRRGDVMHPIAINRERNYITCSDEIYHLNTNQTLTISLLGNFYSDQFGPSPISVSYQPSYSGCHSGKKAIHNIINNNSTIHTINYCTFNNQIDYLRGVVLNQNQSDFALISHGGQNCTSCTPVPYYGFDKNGVIGTCGDAATIYSVNEGIMSQLTVGNWHQICTIRPDGNLVHDLGTNNIPIDFRAHESCHVAVTSTLLISGTIRESIAGAKSVDCQTQDQVVINRNGYLEYWWTDSDGDGVNDLDDVFPLDHSQQFDSDLDGYGDNGVGNNPDSCPFSPGESFVDSLGCPDDDKDGWSNSRDKFSYDSTQWNDTDSDGYGDNISGFQGDTCPSVYGRSDQNETYGCTDFDDDGWADLEDKFVNMSSQWEDTDNDGFGNELTGFEGDACPNEIGTSHTDRFGCLDSDGDGWSDDGDDLPFNPTQWIDRDGDGYGENLSQNASEIDLFPNDRTQWNDSDGDGFGDDPFGSDGDQYPSDPTEWADTDGDGIGNNADAFPFDPSQQTDSDGDGFGDNERGSGADKFQNDSTQWADIDGDGRGDNQDGTNPDAFIADPTQWADTDGDGYGDNPTGRQADGFTDDATQWLDQDGDGLGDNLSGNNPDPYLFDFDNDGYNDSIDPLPKLASPGDLDNDGTPDVDDLFPEDFREWADADGDGEGDNADTDDDNDGWADTDELREGTDPFSSSSQPVNSFEIVLPGTTIGLGAWDLIGMFGGIPLFAWIGFGFVTRNGRTAKYETRLREANTRDELEGVARQWEYSLMLRLLGPHQGIRLERLRAELDDRYEAQNQRLSSIEPEPHDQTEMVEEAMQVEQKSLPSIEATSLNLEIQGNPDGKGYEWHADGQGTSWYRNEGSNSEWQRFEQ